MEGPQAGDYRDWDEQADRAWFRYQRPPAPAVLARVRPLTTEYGARLWGWVFPTDKGVLPLVAKDDRGWLKEVFAGPPVWYGGPDNPPLSESLRRLSPWPDADPVFFLVRRGVGYQAPWRVYVEHWQHFLGWYDEGLLLHPTAREVAAFWEVGAMFVGRRSKRRLVMRGPDRGPPK